MSTDTYRLAPLYREALEILPAFYRERDARLDGQPGLLETVLGVIAEQFGVVHDDLDQLYDDLFIETCSPQMIAYMGDLVAVLPGAPVESDAVLTRAAVADAIALRRRKGTAAVLEQLALAITGWPAVAVEMFQRLVVTQNVTSVAPARGSTQSMRSALALERVGGAFETGAHLPDMRRIGSGRGRYNVPNVAVLVWRDIAQPRTEVDAAAASSTLFRFNPLGIDSQLVTRRRTESSVSDQATTRGVPGALTRRTMAASLGDYYGPALSVEVRRAGNVDAVPVADIVVCNLGDTAEGPWSNASRLLPHQVGVDPELGRLAFGTPPSTPPLVSFELAAPSAMGGTEFTPKPPPQVAERVVDVRRNGAGFAHPSIADGLADANGAGMVRILDSRTYVGDLDATVATSARLKIVSDPGSLPTILLNSSATVTAGEGGVIELRGLIVSGGPLIVRGRPARVEIVDCTFVPGQRLSTSGDSVGPVGPSILLDIDEDWQTDVVISGSVVGPLWIPADGSTLSITDSIVDSVRDGRGDSGGATPARIVPLVRSSREVGALSLAAGGTRFRLAVGTDPVVEVVLAAVPTDAASAAALIDTALTGTGVHAVSADGRVVVLEGARPLAISDVDGGTLAESLGLTGAAAQTRGVSGGAVDLTVAAAGGAITVTGTHGWQRTVTVAGASADLASIAQALQASLRTIGDLGSTLVTPLSGALLLVPAGGSSLTIAATVTDASLAPALGLVSPRPAIAADSSGAPGATLSLDRCTVVGAVRAGAVDTVRDTIITGVIVSDRRQVGCLEYSWIAPGSITPRRHECQPATADTPAPRFVSTHYGATGYGRLRRRGASALIRGASDGFEMGGLAQLRQTQRDDNLRRGIEEFVRFGLEAGVCDGE